MPATLNLVAPPMGVMILPVITCILIDLLISHWSRSPDLRPCTPTYSRNPARGIPRHHVVSSSKGDPCIFEVMVGHETNDV
ncbi:hypothetical protein BJV74DRAFT_869269 [Russula compacta]|nr:hypothetical protein BJV74DRAFT_869269 [Russula compacta]